jgi:hypothetical protein
MNGPPLMWSHCDGVSLSHVAQFEKQTKNFMEMRFDGQCHTAHTACLI